MDLSKTMAEMNLKGEHDVEPFSWGWYTEA